MTYAIAIRTLPAFARHLAPRAAPLIALRDSVQEELNLYFAGDNPLEPWQVEALQLWLQRLEEGAA